MTFAGLSEGGHSGLAANQAIKLQSAVCSPARKRIYLSSSSSRQTETTMNDDCNSWSYLSTLRILSLPSFGLLLPPPGSETRSIPMQAREMGWEPPHTGEGALHFDLPHSGHLRDLPSTHVTHTPQSRHCRGLLSDLPARQPGKGPKSKVPDRLGVLPARWIRSTHGAILSI